MLRRILLTLVVVAWSFFPVTQNALSQEGEAETQYNLLMAEACKLSEIGEARQEVAEKLKQAFDLRQEMQRQEVAAARAELDEIERRINEREKMKDAIVRRKVEDMMSGKDLSWSANLEQERDGANLAALRIRPGDIVALYLDGVLPFTPPNAPPTPPPVTKLDSGAVVTGYPLAVASDGTIAVPLIEPVKIEGMTIREAEQVIRKAYINNDILRPEKARPMMTIVPRR